jgi:peptide/nickel transport system permease protein
VAVEQSTDFSLDTASVLAQEEGGAAVIGRSPWQLAWRRLKRNKVAWAFLAVFVLIVAACLLAPVYSDLANTGPNEDHAGESVVIDGKQVPVLSQGGIQLDPETGQPVAGSLTAGGVPLGPQWGAAGWKFVLGADLNGRDIAVRLLYGGRNSLLIGISSALICTLVALALALLAGYYGGAIDWVITRFFDIIWAFPVLLLAIALGTALSINGFHHRLLWLIPINIAETSLWIPILVISYVLIPYIGRPLRGQILSLRQKEFIEAAEAQGAGAFRIMFAELLPNVASSGLVFFTLIIASNMLTEAGLSFLGAGVRPPNPSWGTLIAEGEDRLATSPWLTLVPGVAIVLTVLSLNVFGDGLRDALDPRAKVRVEH